MAIIGLDEGGFVILLITFVIIITGVIYFAIKSLADNADKKAKSKKHAAEMQSASPFERYSQSHPYSTSVASNKITQADEISKYKKLLDDGAITQEEYDAKKKQLLGL